MASKPLLEEVRRIIKFLHLPDWVTAATSGVLPVVANNEIACVTASLHPLVLALPLSMGSVCAAAAGHPTCVLGSKHHCCTELHGIG